MRVDAKTTAWLLLLVAILLSTEGCAGAVPSPTPAAAVPASASPSPAARQSSTPGLFPTPTAEASPTPPSSPSPTPSTKYVPQPQASPTPPGQALFRPPAGLPDGQSTDGQWLWRIESDSDGFLVTRLVRKDASQDWPLQFHPQDFPARNFESLYLFPVFWLPKEPYVFLNGVAACPTGSDTFTLLRFNLRSGVLATVIPGSPCQLARAFYFSSTGRYLLSDLPDLPGVQLQRLSDGEVKQIRLPAGVSRVSYVSWSPDETRAVVETCRVGQKAANSCAGYPLYLIEAEEGFSRPLLADTTALKLQADDHWQDVLWLSANRISIHMLSGGVWELNLVTGQLFCRAAQGGVCRPVFPISPAPGR